MQNYQRRCTHRSRSSCCLPGPGRMRTNRQVRWRWRDWPPQPTWGRRSHRARPRRRARARGCLATSRPAGAGLTPAWRSRGSLSRSGVWWWHRRSRRRESGNVKATHELCVWDLLRYCHCKARSATLAIFFPLSLTPPPHPTPHNNTLPLPPPTSPHTHTSWLYAFCLF